SMSTNNFARNIEPQSKASKSIYRDSTFKPIENSLLSLLRDSNSKILDQKYDLFPLLGHSNMNWLSCTILHGIGEQVHHHLLHPKGVPVANNFLFNFKVDRAICQRQLGGKVLDHFQNKIGKINFFFL